MNTFFAYYSGVHPFERDGFTQPVAELKHLILNVGQMLAVGLHRSLANILTMQDSTNFFPPQKLKDMKFPLNSRMEFPISS